MKTLTALLVTTLALAAGCGGESEPEKTPERFEKPYEDQVKAIEQQNLQRVEDQKKAIDEQSEGRSDREDDK